MSTQTAKITYLDGVRLYRAIVAGIRQVISQQEYLNNINVFPVPDRDTGTNMALTLNSVLEGTYAHHSADIHDLLDNVANAALNGARGNSGAILAQFFQGLSEGAKSVQKKMTTKNFVAAISTAVNHAHRALSQPKEGTILTILRDFSDEITHQQMAKNELDFVELFSAGIARAKESLAHTAFQLKEMKKAGVVDAGAQGFVEFLNGINDFILSGSIKDLQHEITDIEIKEISEDEIFHEVDERFRFCTECLITKVGDIDINQDELRNTLDELGNSLIVAGSSKKTKIHVHTNDPKKIFEICRQHGNVTGEKADDMINQQKSFANRENRVAILTDSAADIPSDILNKLNIHVVPILLNFGSESYLDKISITPEEFFQKIKTHSAHPTTSQPSLGDFNRQYQYLATHFDSIVAIHFPENLSGTLGASQKAANKLEGKANTAVIDSLSGGLGQGLVVMRAAEAAQAGYSKDEIIELTKEAAASTKTYIITKDLPFMTRGGRISEKVAKTFQLLNLLPVLQFSSEGKIKPASVVFGKNNLTKKLLSIFKRKTKKNIRYRVGVAHGNCEEVATVLAEKIKEKFPDQIDEVYVLPLCAAISAHTGTGALGLAFQPVTPLQEKDSA